MKYRKQSLLLWSKAGIVFLCFLILKITFIAAANEEIKKPAPSVSTAGLDDALQVIRSNNQAAALPSAQPTAPAALTAVNQAQPQEKIAQNNQPSSPAAVQNTKSGFSTPGNSADKDAKTIKLMQPAANQPMKNAGPLVDITRSEIKIDKSSQPNAFKFVEHMKDAEAVFLHEDKENTFGRWVGDRFFFSGMGEAGEVRVMPVTINEISKNVIRLLPPSGAILQLQFRDVPSAVKMRMAFGFDKSTAAQNQGVFAYAYIRVLIGQKEMKRYRIASNDQWRVDDLDLGVVSFLNHPITVTFQISSDSPVNAFLNFSPELQTVN